MYSRTGMNIAMDLSGLFRRASQYLRIAPLLFALAIAGCGGHHEKTPTPTPPASLSSIAVTPGNQSTIVGGTVQFVATGTYSDGSTKNLTTSVTWTSSATVLRP